MTLAPHDHPFISGVASAARPPMIIQSLLDTDLYKFTMMQVVLHHFPGAQVEYRFKCRNAGRRPARRTSARSATRSRRSARCASRDDELDYLRALALLQERLRRPARPLPARRAVHPRQRRRRRHAARSTSRSRGRGCTRSCSRCRCSRSCPRSTSATRSRGPDFAEGRAAARDEDRAAQRGARTRRLPDRRLRHAPALLARVAGRSAAHAASSGIGAAVRRHEQRAASRWSTA